MRPYNLFTVVAVLSAALLLFLPEAAWCHAFPDHSDPKVGSTVSGPPAQVRIWFDSDLEPAFSNIMVHNADGKMIDKRDVRVAASDPKLLQVSVPPLQPGTYLVIWNVVARDGHRTNGQFSFTMNLPAAETAGYTKTKSKIVPAHILKSFSCPVRLSTSDLSRC
jgi:methionine-rich copper-binding protein CopC